MKRITETLIMLLAATLISCSTHKNVASDVIPTEAGMREQEIQASEYWGQLMVRVLDEEESTGNVCISPFSAQMAMSMTAAGATGSTQKEMYNAMRLYGDVNATSKELLENINSGSNGCEVRSANSIWINEELDTKEGFINSSKEFFNALVTRAPFNSSTLKRINSWCEEETNGKIKSVLDKIGKNDRMYLINALYFKGAWDKKFSKSATDKKPFTTEDGKVVKVDMMHQTIRTGYFENEDLQIVSKPFNGRYRMLFILPSAENSIADALIKLACNYDSCVSTMSTYEVELSLPKFRSEYSTSLKQPFMKMGVEKAFSGEAEFDGISGSPLYIDNVIQKTYINVDEEGAEAAAATLVSMALTSFPRPVEKRIMNIDRPFIFMITDNTAKNILFIGKVANPNE